MTFTGLVVLALAAGVVFFLLTLVSRKKPGRGLPWRYQRKPLLTPNEQEFFGRLLDAVPEFHVFPQVAMSQLMEVKARGRRDWLTGFNGISRKVVDFVVTDRKLRVIALIELDDRTHDARKDRERDEMTAEAGYRTLRYQSREKPSAGDLRRELRRLAG